MPSLDLTQLVASGDFQAIIVALLGVGAATILPRVARMGIGWIKGAVDDDAAGDRWASRNGIWYDDDGYARTRDGGYH